METNKRLSDNLKIRKIIEKHIIEELNNIEPTDILINIENDERLNKMFEKFEGDVISNPEIAKLEDDIFKLIKLSLKNCKSHIKQFMPLWLIDMKK